MADIQNPKLLYFKGALFLWPGHPGLGDPALGHPNVRFAALLAVAIWAFARAYYFAFYVVEHYIDSEHKYAGLLSFLRYLARSRK